MGEIIFSLFIGSCFIFIGSLLIIRLRREEKEFCKEEN